jgi:hypothetical protein
VYGTVGLQAAKYSFLAPFKVFGLQYRRMKGDSALFQILLLFVSLFLFSFTIGVSFMLVEVTIIEFVIKKALRSKIEARATVDPQNPDDVLVEFTLSGISARLTKAAITNAFVTPERPILMAKA